MSMDKEGGSEKEGERGKENAEGDKAEESNEIKGMKIRYHNCPLLFFLHRRF